MQSVQLAPRRMMDPQLAAKFSRAAVGLRMRNCLYALAIKLDCLDMLRDAGGFG
jgi:hypothetical protein